MKDRYKLLPSSAGGISSAGVVAALAEFTSFGDHLETVDAFLDASLFLSLMGISLAAGALLSSAADQRSSAAHSKYLATHKRKELDLALSEAQNIANGASY
ncbi:MAG: hypothetical protein RIC89_01660 [Pseudomonadales bacterium]